MKLLVFEWIKFIILLEHYDRKIYYLIHTISFRNKSEPENTSDQRQRNLDLVLEPYYNNCIQMEKK